MKISTKGRYGLRLMLDLAVNYENGYIPLKEIASRQSISDKYLEQIIIQLNKAGFVKSVRGAQGGYRLAKEPSSYTAGDILRVMEGSLAPVACVADDAEPCKRMDCCVTVKIWSELKTAIDKVVDSYTLADLVEQYNDKNPEICEYYI